ncbi:MAG: hypothetical protein IJP98_06570 [Clostridia bacterium]|nr:hypothetical protein [Clostridia bacterium]
MKQQKMTDYKPSYPKRFFQGAAITAATVLALSPMTGCKPLSELTTSGAVAIDQPTDDPGELVLDGEVMIDEPTDEGTLPDETEACPDDVLVTDGEVAVDEPDDMVRTDGIVALPEDGE